MKIPITFPDPDPEPEVVDIIQERTVEVIGWLRTVFHCLNAYQLHQVSKADMANKSVKRLRMSVRAMALALGYPDAAGAECPADLARQLGLSKQMVTKCVNHFIWQLKLSPLTTQRKEEARKNMAAARANQAGKRTVTGVCIDCCKKFTRRVALNGAARSRCPLCHEVYMRDRHVKTSKPSKPSIHTQNIQYYGSAEEPLVNETDETEA